jgi:hypothetical protein
VVIRQGQTGEQADAVMEARVLRLRAEAREGRTAGCGQEVAPPHSITSSAQARSRLGTLSPSASHRSRQTDMKQLTRRSVGY